MSCTECSRHLQAIGFQFESVEATHDDNVWLEELGALMHAASRARLASSTPTRRLGPQGASSSSSGTNTTTAKAAAAAAFAGTGSASTAAAASGSGGRASGGNTAGGGVGESEFDEIKELGPESLEALEGVGLPRKQWVWLQRQRVLWRSGRLHFDRICLLYAAGTSAEKLVSCKISLVLRRLLLKSLKGVLKESNSLRWRAGIEMDPYTTSQWRRLAHATSSHLLMHAVPFLTARSSAPKVPPLTVRHSEVRRWVLTQQRLMHEGRITRPQAEYLTAAGLGWLLVRDAVVARDDAWQIMLRCVGDALGLAPKHVSDAIKLLSEYSNASASGAHARAREGRLGSQSSSARKKRKALFQEWGLGRGMKHTDSAAHPQHAQHARHTELQPVAHKASLRSSLLATFSWNKGSSHAPQQKQGLSSKKAARSKQSQEEAHAPVHDGHVPAHASYAFQYSSHHSTANAGALLPSRSGSNNSHSMHNHVLPSTYSSTNNSSHGVSGTSTGLHSYGNSSQMGGYGAAAAAAQHTDLRSWAYQSRHSLGGVGGLPSSGALHDPTVQGAWRWNTRAQSSTPATPDHEQHAATNGSESYKDLYTPHTHSYSHHSADSGDMHENLVEQAFASTRATMHEEHATPEAWTAKCAASFCAALDECESPGHASDSFEDVHGMHERARSGYRNSMLAWTDSKAMDSEAVLADWLEQQRALLALGFLSRARAAALVQTVSHLHASDAALETCSTCGRSICNCAIRSDQHVHEVHESGALAAKADALGALCAAHRALSAQHSNSSISDVGEGLMSTDAWGEGMAQLMRFRRRYGNVDVPPLGPHEELAAWLEHSKAQRDTLRPQQVAQLWSLGVPLHLRTPVRR